ncbi:hypothetical protein [Actinoplanes aureus]|uniref:Uncharacterized protein n=1 Tax=Actinoplanes aureus TaxID=2792083 RepID=A0A931CJD3_9ACTN|nr:hypothetical protein [Actinoplanes aureus]MBG0568191.1 hypothetical protein [Actinoplanes aureus]
MELEAAGLVGPRPVGGVSQMPGPNELYAALASSAVLVSVVQAVQAYITRNRGTKGAISINGDSIEVDDASSVERQRLIDAWVARHSPQSQKTQLNQPGNNGDARNGSSTE